MENTTTVTTAIKQDTNELFPVFLKLDQLNVLIVGGGKVGLEKLHALVHNSPASGITLVATEISHAIKTLVQDYPKVELHERPFEESDIEGRDIIIVAVNKRDVSASIHEIAKRSGKLVNVADTPDLCDFYLSSVVKKGNLKLAISTNGKSPTAAKRIKEVLNDALPAELDEVIRNLHQVRGKLNGNFENKVKKLNALTKVLVESDSSFSEKRWKRVASYSVAAFAFMLIGHFIFSYLPLQVIAEKTLTLYRGLDANFHWMVLAGFLAQMVDGATSMGYGVTSAIALMSANVSPAAISGSIHTAEMFASGASGYSHYKFGNVNKKLFKALLVPGVIGAVLGAVLLVKFGETHIAYIRPIMAMYTLVLGIRIFITAFKKSNVKKKFKRYGWLAGAGGFFDSFGGGGWGPIVTATLITKGRTPRYVVGSVSLTEFFVTLASAFTFFTLIGVQHWQVIIALIVGGLIAAPLAARLNGKLPRKASFILLGVVVVAWSIRILVRAI
ncbi:TSUP family transporter [Terrimonas sp. NA20]|uniref:Probable membrane transporter protein n=1 Tax=Terrimonas ginsenosidimutans TaxID=2908004 RepID=A0ABS9KVF6_9BACT|nr:TSUP family transporter [Terrimonas ginsenosidimutans]MCG2616349.1 TSUP family transporter [Terrimonas ginsenosidimutans]